MINSVLGSSARESNGPVKGCGIGDGGRKAGNAVVNPGFERGTFFVVIPGDKLQVLQLVGRRVVVADVGIGIQESSAAMLVQHARAVLSVRAAPNRDKIDKALSSR